MALGKDLSGQPYVADLHDMPHILIAGATGSGKSICLNTIITSLVYRHTPKTLRLLMVDPKMVELSTYRLLPHLRHKVVTDPRDAAGLLKWAVLEMDRRYILLNANGVRSIGEFDGTQKGWNPPPRLGHLPGAIQFDYIELFDADDGTLKPAAELTTLLGAIGITPEATVVTY